MKKLLASVLSLAFAGTVLAQGQTGIQVAQNTDAPKAESKSAHKGATKTSSKKSSKKKGSKGKSKSAAKA
jgi:hypothetical protein